MRIPVGWATVIEMVSREERTIKGRVKALKCMVRTAVGQYSGTITQAILLYYNEMKSINFHQGMRYVK